MELLSHLRLRRLKMLFKNKEVEHMKKQIERLEDDSKIFHKAINGIVNDVKAVVDTLVRKKIIKVSKKELKRNASFSYLENRLTQLEIKIEKLKR